MEVVTYGTPSIFHFNKQNLKEKTKFNNNAEYSYTSLISTQQIKIIE